MYRDDHAAATVLVVAFRGKVLGIDARTGQRLWQQAIGESFVIDEVELIITPARVFVCDGKVLACLEYPSGTWIGATPLPGKYAGGRPTMVLQGEALYVATTASVTCFDNAGQVVWHDPFEGLGFGSMALGFPGNVRQADDRGRE
jgi:outer membrane protein assembly factor BamB